MIIRCQMCLKEFEWEPVYGSNPKCKPTICGTRDADGKWVLDEKCKKLRQQVYNKKHKKHVLKKPRKKVQPRYECKKLPELQQWKCKRCGALSSNRINCPICIAILSDQLAGDEFLFS